MVVKLEINFTNRWLYSFVAMGILLALGVGVWAYNSNMGAGDPTVMGHSAGDIMVEDRGGNLVKLQDFLDDYVTSEQVYFGGMWGNPIYNNPLTGAQTCPEGYIDKTVRGQAGLDHTLHLCVGVPGEVEKVAEFGGMWGNPIYNNPLTEGKTCPEGYDGVQVLGVASLDHTFYFCYTENLDNPVIKYFGGAYGGPSYENPAGFGMSCPLGYDDAQVLGQSGLDHAFYFCYIQ